MAPDQRNPFDPELDGAALRLTFDSRSLRSLSGHERSEAEFLLSLAHTEKIDGLVVWAEEGFAPDLPAAEMLPGRGHLDSVTVGLHGEPEVIGVIPLADQWQQMAMQYELSERDGEWLVHYGIATSFHSRAGRHFFVTMDRELLRARGTGPFRSLWRGTGICSVREALFHAGALMRVYGWLCDDVEPDGYTHRTSVYMLRTELAVAGLPNRKRLFRWLAQQNQAAPDIRSMQRLEQSLVTRALDLLRARDGVERETRRTRRDNATVDAVEYHLHAAVSALAAAFDSVSLLCCTALGVPEIELPQEQASLRSKDWRKAVANHGGQATSKAASAHAPVLAVVKSFRDPIIHQSGMSGRVVHHLDGAFSEMEIAELGDDQTRALEALGTKNGAAKRWGLRRSGTAASLVPLAFATRLAHDGMAVLDDVLGALASDLALPVEPHTGPAFMSEVALRRLRLLTGLDPAA